MANTIKLHRYSDEGPTTADVHPDEVQNWLQGGWFHASPEAEPEIPADFPGALSLRDAGITKLTDLEAFDEAELRSVKGIGAATAKAICLKRDELKAA